MEGCGLVRTSFTVPEIHGNIEQFGSKHVVELSCTWTITKLDCSFTIRSPTFSAVSSNELKWFLKLFPASEPSYLSLFLYLEPCTVSEVRAQFKFSILNSDGRKSNTMGGIETAIFNHNLRGYGFKKYIKTDLLTLQEPQGILVNGNLVILCEIKDGNDFDNTAENSSNIRRTKVPNDRLLEDVALFESQRYTDFTIIANKKEFSVHRAILSSRSSVFLAMFEHNMKEREQNHVEIKDMDSEVLHEMLRFIYTDKVENIEKIAEGLLVAANRYAIERLKNMCEDSLAASLTIQNATDILILADTHNADWLKTTTLEFIAKRKNTSKVMDTEEFTSMITSHPSLIVEILRVTNER